MREANQRAERSLMATSATLIMRAISFICARISFRWFRFDADKWICALHVRVRRRQLSKQFVTLMNSLILRLCSSFPKSRRVWNRVFLNWTKCSWELGCWVCVSDGGRINFLLKGCPFGRLLWRRGCDTSCNVHMRFDPSSTIILSTWTCEFDPTSKAGVERHLPNVN